MGAGRPTDYKPEYNEQAYKLCLLGHTDKELASFFEVSESTINLWKLEHIEFSESIKRGKDIADADISQKLYHRAIGYSHPDVEIKVVAEGQGLGSRIEEVPVIKHYPPDPTSMIFWLKNRQPKKWRDKQEVEHSGEITNPSINLVIKSGGQELASSENDVKS